MTAEPSTSAPQAPSRRRKRRLLMLAIPLAVAMGSGVVYLQGGRYAETDNAYVKADKLAISADVSGKVVAVHVTDNARVAQGAPLFDIDPLPFDVALRKAEANVAQARTNVRALQVSYREAQAQIRLGETKQRFAEKEQQRLNELRARGFASVTQLDAAKQATEIAAQSVATQREELQRIAASLGGNPQAAVDSHPSVRAALAEVAQAQLNRSRTQVHAAQSGTISHLPVLGQFVATGATSAALVADAAPWVEANFTETELAHVRPGQHAEVTLDIAPDVHLSGVVDSLSPATGPNSR